MVNLSREKFKTILLTILVVLSVALTRQFWMDSSFLSMGPSLNQMENNYMHMEEDAKISDILSPQSFIVNFGGGLHTMFYTDSQGIWQEALRIIKEYYFQENVIVEEINREQWIEINNTSSMTMNFGFSMSVDGLREMVEAKEKEKVLKEEIMSFDQMLIPAIEDGNIYIGHTESGKYYKVQSENIENDFSDKIKAIQENQWDVYYAIGDIYDVQNPRIMPVDLSENVQKIKVNQEIESNNDLQVDAFAGTFFGENFDFVRKIRETQGSVIYMYGYGQKSLKIDAAGKLEYIEEIDFQKSEKNIEFWEGIQTAVEFVRQHGGWPNQNVYLKEYKNIEKDKKKGYQFIFGYRLNGLPVHYEEKTIKGPIEVQVMGTQVTYYKRFVNREKAASNFLEIRGDEKILSPTEIIDKNFSIMKNDYIENIKEDRETKNIEKRVLSSIQGVEIGYYAPAIREPNQLVPVWIMRINKHIYYFDAYNGNKINRSEI